MATDRFAHVYQHRAADYDRLVSREDYHERLPHALARACAPAGLDVVETGAGTGRLTRLLAPAARRIHAFDASRAMLDVAAAHLRRAGCANACLGLADHRALPLPARCADLALEGWSFGHLAERHPDRWRAEVQRAVAELRRVVRPGGTVVLVETLGTGRTEPRPPSEALARMYTELTVGQGFAATWLRTDYRFASVAEAEALTRMFFGDELADRVAREGSSDLAECTGIWWRRV